MRRGCALFAAFAVLAAGSGSAAAAAPDQLKAGSAVPPGQSGFTSTSQFTEVTLGLASSYGPHTDDQRQLYANFHYKPMQFAGPGQGVAPPGDSNVTIRRDPRWGVPTIVGKTDGDAFYGIGYAMAADRLFQMEVFRHVGQGTLAELIGQSGLAMDEAVRQVSEGAARRLAEYNRLPADARIRLQRFVDGVNAYIDQAQQPGNQASMLPAEFTLLNDVPVKHWSIDDLLGFGEYAGRFFGEFGHGELGAAKTFQDLLRRFSRKKAERIFHDLLPLNYSRAPTSIAAADGRFPRHTRGHVKSKYRTSPYANHAPGVVPKLSLLAPVANAVDRRQALISTLQRRLAIPRFGSNAVIVSGRRTKDHRPMLYGGPQTGWAVPGFFWEADVHSPIRNERGVMVPAVPLFVIGRNARAAWTVTSALDANADTFVEKLDSTNSTYVHRGHRLPVSKRVETIKCNNPPTTALPLLSGQPPTPCPVGDVHETVYRTVHGPSVAGPDKGHHLYVRQSVVDGRLLNSLVAWDVAGRRTTVGTFGNALRQMSLGFNFFYAGDDGHIGYWHTGAYPIRPRNADPTLPMPGDGRYDWRGLESWKAHPHVIDPKSGFLVNWNNKPSVGWWSKNLEVGGEGGIWGPQWEHVPLAADVRRRSPLDYRSLGQVPRDVAYIDNRARLFLPRLRSALKHVKDPKLVKMRGYLRRWNGRRNVGNSHGNYGTPAVVFFDRFVEKLMRDAEQPLLGADWVENAGLDCATCHLRSVDNLAAPTYKFEYAGEQVLVAALRNHTRYRWIGHPDKLFVRAARDAAAELSGEQGGDPSKWDEPIETGEFSAQGAISVPALLPLPNRGSYAQLVKTLGATGHP